MTSQLVAPARLAAALLLAVSTLGALPAHSQHLSPGLRVRVTTADARTIGRVDHTTADSLLLVPQGLQRPALAWSDIERVEYSRGRRGHAGRGALIGAGVMTAFTVGAILFGNSDNEMEDDLEDTILIITLPVNAALGAGIGALVGLAWRTERWSVLPIGMGAASGRPGVAATIRLP